jgi:predicted nucleotidyltransferase
MTSFLFCAISKPAARINMALFPSGSSARWLGGSVARGEIRDDSDVDIYVTTREPDPFVLVHIKDDIERRLQRHVDIIRVRENMNPFLKKRIGKEGIYV